VKIEYEDYLLVLLRRINLFVGLSTQVIIASLVSSGEVLSKLSNNQFSCCHIRTVIAVRILVVKITYRTVIGSVVGKSVEG
jgi:hypothetical protein